MRTWRGADCVTEGHSFIEKKLTKSTFSNEWKVLGTIKNQRKAANQRIRLRSELKSKRDSKPKLSGHFVVHFLVVQEKPTAQLGLADWLVIKIRKRLLKTLV